MFVEHLSYACYEAGLPQWGPVVLCKQHKESLWVYQAFSAEIASYAVEQQQFGGSAYSFSRMTWIKPNFLWMMYRSSWATAKNQERILAIELRKQDFFTLLQRGVLSSFDPKKETQENWKKRLNESDVRIQWDPDHDAKGTPLKRRAVQIGIKGESLREFNEQMILSIQDITDFVAEARGKKEQQKHFYVPNEWILPLPDSLAKDWEMPWQEPPKSIGSLIAEFEQTGELSEEQFASLLIEGENNKDFCLFVRNFEHKNFSRYLLKKALYYRALREQSPCECLCEDLLSMGYLVAKNGEEEDCLLLLQAKLADFDTWCGFDGEMVFYALGREKTLAFLHTQKDWVTEEQIAYLSMLDLSESNALWYL